MGEETKKSNCPLWVCPELFLGMAEQPGESEWQWQIEETNSVCSWLPDHEEEVEGAQCRQIGA